MENYDKQLQNLVEDFALDFEKFKSGNKTAGTRARNSLQRMKQVAQLARVAIQDEKNKK